MNKIKARAHSNIALVKYWGKRDIDLNLPAVASISITLDALYTETEISLDGAHPNDELILNGEIASDKDTKRLSTFLEIIRQKSNTKLKAVVKSFNNFPTSAGLASSASSFACLALAASKAMNLNLSNGELSELARIGSGSAARSIFGGFVEMKLGEKNGGSDSVAFQLHPKDYWDLTILIAVTSEKKKKTGSTDGMELSRKSSPYYKPWIESSYLDIDEMREAIKNKDFQKVAEVSEFSCLKMHALALSSKPGLLYWNGTTVNLIHKIRSLREKGIPVFFTIDAGPQVKAICATEYAEKVKSVLNEENNVKRVIETHIGGDAVILEDS